MGALGNSPEFMPWDCSLNNDLKLSCDIHVILTNNIPDTDPEKISMSTPKRGAQCWMRLLHPDIGRVPSSTCIIQYVCKVFFIMEAVVMADGIAIKSVGDRSGKRYIAMEPFPRGGKRAKSYFSDQSVPYVHPNASITKQIKVEASISLFKSSFILEGSDPADALLVSGYI